jgi:hypothetical protein
VWLWLGAADRERQRPWHTWPGPWRGQGAAAALSGRLRGWCGRCIAWEVSTGGRLWPPWHTRPGPWIGQGTAFALSGRLGPWRSRCIAWEVASNRGRGAGGWRAAVASWGHGAGGWWAAAAGRGSADCGCNWPVAKASTKLLNAKKKHKFFYSVVVRIVYTRQEVHEA